MKTLSALLLLSWISAGTASAQAFPPNDVGATISHWHLNSRDVEANKKIFLTLGGEALAVGPGGMYQAVRFPGVDVHLQRPNSPPPPTGGSVGSVVNHLTFSVQNLQQSLAKWKAAGLTLLPGENNRADQAFVETPDGVRFEIVENRNQKFLIQGQRIYFRVAEAQMKAMQAWYAQNFGIGPSAQGPKPAAGTFPVDVTFAASAIPTAPTMGRALDHIGFYVREIAAVVKKLEAAGAKVERPCTPNQACGIAFVIDPWGTYIELQPWMP